MKNLGKKIAKCGKTNHSTQNHWPGGKCLSKGKGKGNEKAQTSANILDVNGLPELSITIREFINFFCYKTSEKVKWYLDSGGMEHITSNKSNFIQYREFGQPESAEITDGKFCTIEGYGTIIGHSIMPQGMASLQIHKVLYVPQANEWVYSLIATGQ